MPFTLRVVRGAPDCAWQFDQPEVVIGSAPGADLVLEGHEIAPRHARISSRNGEYTLEALSGLLKLNREPISVPLRSGDEIAIGPVALAFQATGTDTRIVDSRTIVPRVRRKPWGVAGLAVLVLIGGLAAVLGRQSAPAPKRPRLLSPHTLSEKPSPEVFGVGEGLGITVQAPNEAQFVFAHVEGIPTVMYVEFVASGIERQDQVDVGLNGVQLGFVRPTGDLSRPQRLRLPKKHLEDENELVFDALDNPPHVDPWAISQVRLVIRTPPQCRTAECVRETNERLTRAEALLKMKDVAARNRNDAWALLQQGLLFLEPVEPRPELAGLLTGRVREVERELEEQCGKILLAGKHWEEARNGTRAIAEYRDGLQWFPLAESGEDYPCRGRILERLETLGARE